MVSTRLVLLTGYDAKLCARRVHNNWDDTIAKTEWEIPAELQMRFDEGHAFEAAVFDAIETALDDSRYVDLSGEQGKANVIAATISAMDDQVEVILGGWLPDDVTGGRTGRPDVLLRHHRGGYLPGDVKAHKTQNFRAKGTLTYSLLNEPGHLITATGLAAQTTTRLEDHLQLAHYWRMLEAAGCAPDTQAVGFIIGTDNLTDTTSPGPILTWVCLSEPVFDTFSRSTGSAKRTALERYDHEQGFRLRVATAAVDRAEPLVQPIFTDECNSCPWFDYCRDITGDDAASAQITSGRLSVREWKALAAAGVVTVEQMANLDVDAPGFQTAYLPEVTHIKDPVPRLAVAIRRARMIRDGVTLERKTHGPIPVPRADIEIDFDIEWDPNNCVYLWGALVSRAAQEPEYHPVVSWEVLDDTRAVELATLFATWLREQILAADRSGHTLLVPDRGGRRAHAHPLTRHRRAALSWAAS